MKINDFDCNVLCDLGAGVSVMPKSLYDMLEFKPLEDRHFRVHLAELKQKV